jgi:hypothetical protein
MCRKIRLFLNMSQNTFLCLIVRKKYLLYVPETINIDGSIPPLIVLETIHLRKLSTGYVVFVHLIFWCGRFM